MEKCDRLTAKCVMWPVLKQLYQSREPHLGRLGQLGPCVFEPIESFLTRETLQTGQKHTPTTAGIVVGVGDVHGDFLALLSVLYLMELIDSMGTWVGGDTHLVLTGDWVDRTGRGSKDTSVNPREEVDIIQYLWALKADANVTVCIGNHELATVWLQNHRYRHYREYSNSLQVHGWGGVENKQSLWSPGGKMALFLAQHCPLIKQVNSFLFMHGGIPQKAVDKYKSIKNINLNP